MLGKILYYTLNIIVGGVEVILTLGFLLCFWIGFTKLMDEFSENRREKMSKINFRVKPLKDKSGYYIDVGFQHISGFTSEEEANNWIKNDSVFWLKMHENADVN